MEETKALTVDQSPIPGMVVVRLPVHPDSRGWFKENWQRNKMCALGLPDFGPVQNNISFNAHRGVTRGFHAEPWDKFVSVATGRVYAAWVDLREGASFGATFAIEIDPSVAVFVPRGVANAYQALDDGTAYTYLVNEHWRPGVTYPAANLADERVGVAWPIPLADADISDKDLVNPLLGEVTPIAPRKTLVIGAGGQVGKALLAEIPGASGVTRAELDIEDLAEVRAWPWHEYGTVINAAAFTAVDSAEQPEGRRKAWLVNAVVPAELARVTREHGVTLVHFSSDYVFDGALDRYDEESELAPLGAYGQSKAAGDLAVAANPRHYILRTSWVIGDGRNFVRTMQSLASSGVRPAVVDDQVGRLTFASDLAGAVRHLLDIAAPFGVYNCTNEGREATWADIARSVFVGSGRSADDVRPVSTAEFAADKALAPRPSRSVLDLTKLRSAGYVPRDWESALNQFVTSG